MTVSQNLSQKHYFLALDWKKKNPQLICCIFKLTSSWSTSSLSTFNSERSAAASFPSALFSLMSLHSSFLHFVTFNLILSGSRRGMGGMGFVPFRPRQGAGCLTRVGFSCRGACFSCKFSPGGDTNRCQSFAGASRITAHQNRLDVSFLYYTRKRPLQ